MTRLLTITGLIAVLSGCIIVDDNDGGYIPPAPVATNSTPWVDAANAGCAYDPSYNQDIWYFEAWTNDYDGAFDVVQVWADVYDDRSGALVESFALYPTDDPTYWYADYLTGLNCWYPSYSVDLVAYDSWDAASAITILPATYR
jgi:hypothetical protein